MLINFLSQLPLTFLMRNNLTLNEPEMSTAGRLAHQISEDEARKFLMSLDPKVIEEALKQQKVAKL